MLGDLEGKIACMHIKKYIFLIPSIIKHPLPVAKLSLGEGSEGGTEDPQNRIEGI